MSHEHMTDAPARPAARRFVAFAALAVITAAAFCATFAVRVAVAASAAAEAEGQKPAQAAPAFPRVSEKMEEELEMARTSAFEWTTTGIHDPFVDREGYGGAKVSAPVMTAAPVPPAQQQQRPSAAGQPFSQQPPAPDQAAVRGAQEAADKAARDRLKGREYDAAAYSHKELLPVGITGKGRSREAYFYGLPTKKYFSVSVKARLLDATLEDITEDGVVFNTASGRVSVGWARVPAKRDGGSRAAAEAEQPAAKPQTAPPPKRQQPAPVNRQYEGLQHAVRNRYPRAP